MPSVDSGDPHPGPLPKGEGGGGIRRRTAHRDEVHRVVATTPCISSRPAEQPFLAAEGRIQARAVDPHRLGQVGERRPLVTPAPEDPQRPVQGLIDVERARTSRRHDQPPPSRPTTLPPIDPSRPPSYI